jgi:hypothetical protein
LRLQLRTSPILCGRAIVAQTRPRAWGVVKTRSSGERGGRKLEMYTHLTASARRSHPVHLRLVLRAMPWQG